ncbi:MAG: STAS domain-containing protein [bacterium]|nr:STAS domain-containing protein [bacterium]
MRSFKHSVPILKLYDYLIVPIQIDMDDYTASELRNDILTRIEATNSRGVLIDISVVDMVDSYLGRLLGDTARMARLMDCEVVLVGMQPAVALTLVELGLNLDMVHTSLHLESGIALLNKLAKHR